MQASQGWWSCIAFTRGSLFIRPTYHACPDSGARWGPLLSRPSPPPAPGRWRRIRGDRSSDSSLHLLWHRPDSSPCSYPNWSLLTYCKRGFRCCRLPTPQIHRRKSAGSRSEIALPRGATVPSFHTPPSFLSPNVELLHPVRFRMQMTSLKASSPACSLLHRAPLRRGPPREMLRAFVSEAAWKQRWTPRELSVLSGAEIPPILRAKPGWTPQLTAPQTLCASGLGGLPSLYVEDDWMTRFLGNHLTRLPALSNGINLWMNRRCYRDAHYVFSATVLECLVDTVGE